jgi:Tol biopolymer transport system component
LTVRRLFVLSSLIGLACAVAAGASSSSPAPAPGAATTTLESVATSGVQGNLDSFAVGISANGRYVVFNSDATNLVPGDTNNQSDVFVRDRLTGETSRASLAANGAQANQSPSEFGGSRAGGISANGRYVVFNSDATNLVPRDTNHAFDIFVHDRLTGTTSRVSVSTRGHEANGLSGSSAISADGRYVAFMSIASNLVARDSNRRRDVFVHDRVTGKTQRVSVSSTGRQGNGDSEEPAISANGRYVVFESRASNLVPGDSNRLGDVFVHDRRTGKTRRVSVSSSGKQSTGSPSRVGSNAPAISANGRYVAFHSDTSNLVPRDTNHVFDIFVHDRVTGKTERVSVSSAGAQARGDNLASPAISANGRYVAFASLASNLVAGDLHDITDVFVHDRLTHRTVLASLSGAGEQGNDGSFVGGGALSADDRYLVFTSYAGNLVPSGDATPGPDVFVRDFGAPLDRTRVTSGWSSPRVGR